MRIDPAQNTQALDVHPRIRRLNRLPIYVGTGLFIFLSIIVLWGLSQRGLSENASDQPEEAVGQLASNFADDLTRNIGNGLNEPARIEGLFSSASNPPDFYEADGLADRMPLKEVQPELTIEPETDWRESIARDHDEALQREWYRQELAAVQARSIARNSPMGVDISRLSKHAEGPQPSKDKTLLDMSSDNDLLMDLNRAALHAGMGEENDRNKQNSKIAFLDRKPEGAGYLNNQVIAPFSNQELKRGSMIPATLVTGINSDLPGRITAQVRQNVYDSATGHHILVPQGTKLFGRYDSQVSNGQQRVLVVWTDLVFPSGATLQIEGMAGVDGLGFGGFKDKVDNHYLRVFGSAMLVAAIGTGIDMALPKSKTSASNISHKDPGDAVRRNFAETFGRVASQTIDTNLSIQPTLEIRPGYNFNVLVDQDIVFPPA